MAVSMAKAGNVHNDPESPDYEKKVSLKKMGRIKTMWVQASKVPI